MTEMMQDMSWQEFNDKKDNSIVILPVGSTEQHGPMMPLSVDTIISTSIAKEVAKEVSGIVAPAISYGYKSAPLSGGGPLFPGTIDLNGTTLMNLVFDVLEELIRDGVTKLFIMNGHFENEAFIIEAVDLLSRKYPEVTFVETSWWDQISQEAIDKVFDEVPFPGWALEHAAIAETSFMLHFRPDLVNMELFMEDEPAKELGYVLYPAEKCNVPKSGLLSTVRTSSAEKGKLLTKEVVNNIVKTLKEHF